MPIDRRPELAAAALPRLLGRDLPDLGDALLWAPAGEPAPAAEAEAVRAARQATRVVYALDDDDAAAARHAALAPTCAGLRLVLAADPDPAGDRALCRGDFDLLVISVAHLGDLLERAPHLADAIGLVVIDGLAALAGPAGAAHDRALTLLRLAALPPRVVGVLRPPLDADAAASIGRWLGAHAPGFGAEVGLDLAPPAAPADPPELGPILVALARAGQLCAGAELRRRVLASYAGRRAYEALGARARGDFSACLDAALDRCVADGALRRGDHAVVPSTPPRPAPPPLVPRAHAPARRRVARRAAALPAQRALFDLS